MIDIAVPGGTHYHLEHLVLDVNGTLACDGELTAGVEERLQKLSECIQIHLVTADTHGRQEEIDRRLGMNSHRVSSADQAGEKLRYVGKLGPQKVAAIGNGMNDALMLDSAALGILVIGPEGAAIEALLRAQVVTTGINAALDLLLHPLRLAATLRR